MRPYLIAAILGITAIVVTALALGENGAAAAGGISTIAALAGYQAKAYRDKVKGNRDVTIASLKKAGYTNASLTRIAKKLKSKGV
jgi:hypothetical protein